MYKNIELNESTFFENVLTMRKFILNNVWLGLRRPENTSEWAHYDRIDGVTSVNAYYSLRHNTIRKHCSSFSFQLNNYCQCFSHRNSRCLFRRRNFFKKSS